MNVLTTTARPLTDFEQRIAAFAAAYVKRLPGEDAAGKRNAMAAFLNDVIDLLGTCVADAGGDPEYLPDEDAVDGFMRAAWQDAIDKEEARNERFDMVRYATRLCMRGA